MCSHRVRIKSKSHIYKFDIIQQVYEFIRKKHRNMTANIGKNNIEFDLQ